MTMASAYLLSLPGNATVQISKDELRSLLREIESELHRSKVYRLAVANVQKLLGSSEEQATNLFKAVGREAITLAFKQFAQKNLAATVTETPVQENNTASNNLQENPENQVSSSSKIPEPNLSLSTEVENANQITALKPIQWLWKNQKVSKRQKSVQILAEQRQESLRQIGEQLRQAREAQGLTLQKLNIYTHISVHQMEAVENANLDLLPEDILIRGFIRVMANALGLNGIILANSLPVSNQSKSILPSWYQKKKSPGQLNLEISPVHLYMSYTALVASAVGGLSFISQPTNNPAIENSQVIIPTSSSLCESNQKTATNTEQKVNTQNKNVCLGSNIAPPEAL
ncbi:MAG: hypothetical protein EAZ76_10800 [Nostocales cyanobacterium]|nr:MAG: hypothetical protein EAZ87_11885 [Nostocales cyanobacterium]TAF13789.1 MAG: hypothetical protein EAZ76_10800 [Nostocales cyanobacterium]